MKVNLKLVQPSQTEKTLLTCLAQLVCSIFDSLVLIMVSSYISNVLNNVCDVNVRLMYETSS